jgi:hypothetical protein
MCLVDVETFEVVQGSLTLSLARIGSQVDHSRALNHPDWIHPMLENNELARRIVLPTEADHHYSWIVSRSLRGLSSPSRRWWVL